MSTESGFWDRIAEKYAAQPVKDPEAYEHTLERTRAYLSPGDRVLEVGCGTGTTALKLGPSVGAITGTDYSEGMIAVARRKAAEEGAENVDFRCADVRGATEEPERYDAILAFNLLHLLRDPAEAIGRIRGALRPGGVFVSKTACLGGKGWLFWPVIAVMRLFGRAPHVGFLSIRALEEMIARAGFEIVETGTFPASPPARFVVARKL